MTAPDTARMDRVARKAATARLLRRLCCEHDVSAQSLSVLLGVGAPKASRYLDPDSADTLPASDVAVLPPVVLDALLSHWAEQRGRVVVDAPDVTEQPDDLRALAAIVLACGDVSGHFAAAVADGHVTPQEAERVERECGEAISRLVALRERCRFVAAARGDGVRRQR